MPHSPFFSLFFQEPVKQNNSQYIWPTADFPPSICCLKLVKSWKLPVNANPVLLPCHKITLVFVKGEMKQTSIFWGKWITVCVNFQFPCGSGSSQPHVQSWSHSIKIKNLLASSWGKHFLYLTTLVHWVWTSTTEDRMCTVHRNGCRYKISPSPLSRNWKT